MQRPRLSRRRLFASGRHVAGLAASVAPLAALAATGCVPDNVGDTLRPPPSPRDQLMVFQSLLRGQYVVPFEAPESVWQAHAEPPATVSLLSGWLRVVAEPGSRAFAAPRLPVAPLEPPLPSQLEELTWVASVAVEAPQRFFILCELRFAGEPGAVLVQPTPFDLQITHDTERPAGGTSVSVSRLVAGGTPHSWRLRLDGQATTLLLDGTPIWSLEGRRALAQVTFGETRTDALHGGTLLLRDVVYVRRPARA
jgi:hypothetical protein